MKTEHNYHWSSDKKSKTISQFQFNKDNEEKAWKHTASLPFIKKREKKEKKLNLNFNFMIDKDKLEFFSSFATCSSFKRAGWKQRRR